jgi:hypothetical protein
VRWRLRLVTAVGLGVALAASAAGAIGVDARTTLELAGGAPVAGQQFRVIASIEGLPAGATPPFSYSITFTLSSGLELVKVSQQFNAARCTVGAQVTCTGSVIGGTIDSDAYRLDLRGSAGNHTVRSAVRVEGQTDTDPANNSSELNLTVREAVLAVSAFRLSPSPPRAGRALQATLLLGRGGTPVRPDRVSCKVAVSGKALAGRSVRLANGGRCLWKLPASAKGKRVRGSISATTGGKTLTRRFAATAR